MLPLPDGITTPTLINVKSLLMKDVRVMRTTLKQRMSVKEIAPQILEKKVGTIMYYTVFCEKDVRVLYEKKLTFELVF